MSTPGSQSKFRSAGRDLSEFGAFQQILQREQASPIYSQASYQRLDRNDALVSAEEIGPIIGSVSTDPMMESVFIDPVLGSVFTSPTSSARNFRLSSPVVEGNESDPLTPPVQRDGGVRHEEQKQAEDVQDPGLGEESEKGVEDQPFDSLVQRDQYGGSPQYMRRAGIEYETESVYPAGNFHYFHPHRSQESSDVVPERFHPGKESLSVRQNITSRSKRSTSRSLDRDYRRRVSFTPGKASQIYGAVFPPEARILGTLTHKSPASVVMNHRGGLGEDLGQVRGSVTPPQVLTPPFSHRSGRITPGTDIGKSSVGPRMAPNSPGDEGFMINLTYEGNLVQHPVTTHMRVLVLTGAAAAVYGLTASDTILVLFGMNPRTLSRNGLLSDPPVVGPGATVLVFHVRGSGAQAGNINNVSMCESPTPPTVSTHAAPKFLGNFK
jgi:hypothetical protein